MLKIDPSVRQILQLTLSVETLIMACVMSIALFKNDRPSLYFDEGSLVTYLSSFQLLIVAFFAHKIEKIKKYKDRKGRLLWQIIKIGFIGLAIDEILMIHERLDFLIYYIFSFEETPFTSRIDDLIILLYLVFSLFCIYYYRHEFQKYRAAFPLFILSIVIFTIMLAIDLLNHSPDDLSFLIADAQSRKMVYKFVGPIEEMFKIWLGGVLLTAFYYCWRIANANDYLKRRAKIEKNGVVQKSQQ